MGLVPRATFDSVIGTKWIFKKKVNYLGDIVRNSGRLVAKGIN